MTKKRILSLVVLLIAFTAGGIYLYRNFDEFAALRVEHPSLIFLLLWLILCTFAVNGYVSALWYRIFGLNLSFHEWFGLSAVNTFGNFVTPFRGGAVSNAVYLKRSHGFAYSSFIGILAAISIISFWVNSLVGLLSLIFIYMSHGFFSRVATIVFFCSFIILTCVMWLAPNVNESTSAWLNRFARALNGWRKIRSYRRGLAQTIALLVLNLILLTLMTFVEFKILGFELDLSTALFLSIFPAFSSVISITPGNLGVREAFAVLSGIVVNVPVSMVLAAGLLDRLATFSLSFILGAVYYPRLSQQMSHKAAPEKF